MIRVATVRDLNNRYGYDQEKVLLCPRGHGEFTADLAAYWTPRDREAFLCPECDAELWLQFRPTDTTRLAQRVTPL